MTIPQLRYFRQADRLYVQAQQIWLILTAFVMEGCNREAALPGTITYGDLAKRMGHSDARVGHTLSRQLGIINQYCLDNEVPVLNSIVVTQSTGLPGSELNFDYDNAWESNPEKSMKQLRLMQKSVMAFDWFSVRVPTSGTFRQIWEASN